MVFERQFTAGASLAEIYAYIDHVMDGTGVHVPTAIRVSDSILSQGIAGMWRDVQITMDPEIDDGMLRLIYPRFG